MSRWNPDESTLRAWTREYPRSMAILVMSLFLTAGWMAASYKVVQDAYQVEIGREWLWRARATNDLLDMAKYLNKSLDQLAPFRGNPSWWFAKPDTDFDAIKTNIIETRDNSVKWSNLTGGSLAYQQAVQNLQETISEVAEHLDGVIYWLKNPPWLVVLIICGILSWVGMLICRMGET